MTNAFAEYDDLVHEIYDAALEPAGWPRILERVSLACGASSAILFSPMNSLDNGGLLVSHNVPPATLERWSARSIHDDPYVAACVKRGLVRDGVAVNGAELVSDTELMASRFYQELWQPANIGRVCFGVIFDGTDAHKVPTAISVFRSFDQAIFSAAEVEFIRRLLAHMSRSLGVMFHLSKRTIQSNFAFAALDELASGVVIIDREKRVHFANASARRFFANADPLALRKRVDQSGDELVLHPRLGAMARLLEDAVRAALFPLDGNEPEHFSTALVLPDAEGRPICVLHAAPISGNVDGQWLAWAGNGSPRAVVFFYDLSAASRVRPETLIELYGLTPAEARSALELVESGTVDQMAQRCGVSANTFKTQMQMAYAKTHTHRRADLLKLLMALSQVGTRDQRQATEH